jgi:ribosome-associated protein
MPATARAIELVVTAAEAAADKLADDILAFDVSDQLVITDAFVLCSASNDRQVKAVVDSIEERMLAVGAKPVRREGERENRWVLLDYIDIVVHVQHAEERVFYSLERLWRDCPMRYAGGSPPSAAPVRRRMRRAARLRRALRGVHAADR